MKFELGAEVTIEASGEKGIVVGRAQYSTAEDQYYIRYKTADGNAIESWWTVSALV